MNGPAPIVEAVGRRCVGNRPAICTQSLIPGRQITPYDAQPSSLASSKVKMTVRHFSATVMRRLRARNLCLISGVAIATAVSACSKHCVSSSVGTAAPETQVGFADLFGFDLSHGRGKLPVAVERCLESAREDFNLALNDKPLHNAKTELAALADGGTTTWRGPCYSILRGRIW